MALLLQAILRATDDGHHSAERSKVRAELFSGRRIHGVLGDFTIDRFGDISLRRYGVYRIVNGALGFLEQSG
jgi:hypothetical protein